MRILALKKGLEPSRRCLDPEQTSFPEVEVEVERGFTGEFMKTVNLEGRGRGMMEETRGGLEDPENLLGREPRSLSHC